MQLLINGEKKAQKLLPKKSITHLECIPKIEKAYILQKIPGCCKQARAKKEKRGQTIEDDKRCREKYVNNPQIYHKIFHAKRQ